MATAELQSFLAAAFGPPAEPPKTNSIAGTQSVGAYYGAGLGVALTYGWQQTRDGNVVDVPGIVPKLLGTPGTVRSSAPKLGDDTDTVLSELGYSNREIAALRGNKVVA